MMRFLRTLFGTESKQTKCSSRRPAAGRRLGLEGLESRDLMAVAVTSDLKVTQPLQTIAPSTVTVSIENNDLVIRGTDAADDVKVSYVGGKFVVNVKTLVDDRVISSTTTWRVTGGDVLFYGNKGDDKLATAFSSGNYLRVTANGGDGNDQLNGSWGKDNLQGGAGYDTLIGQGANDLLDGGLGMDYIDGGDGDDTIWCGADYEGALVYGGRGNDTITGSYGPDDLHGGGGNDTIDGSYGEDHLYGDGDNDTLRAGNDSGYNFLDGGAGNDVLHGSYGNDELFGGAGFDRLFGYAGNDIMNGGTGLDVLRGGDGDDSLNGGGDDDVEDRLYGEGGRDTFYWEQYIDAAFGQDYTAPQSECMDFVPGTDIDPYRPQPYIPRPSAN
jgi:Ca2+-binding RTX toxin-like protein